MAAKMSKKKLTVFDMDGTLIDGRVVFAIGERWNFVKKVEMMMKLNIPNYLISEKIAKLLRGLKVTDVIKTIEKIPLIEGVEETFKILRQKGYKIGIISDSYTLATDYFGKKLGANFTIANRLEEKNGILTGKINMPLSWAKRKNCLKHSVCKATFLEKMAKKYKIPLSQTVAIGDSIADICMIEKAGLGMAFDPKHPSLIEKAKVVVKEKNLKNIFKYFDNNS
jgi:phosphoserine phosphatase